MRLIKITDYFPTPDDLIVNSIVIYNNEIIYNTYCIWRHTPKTCCAAQLDLSGSNKGLVPLGHTFPLEL